MEAYRTIRSELRDNAASATNPYAALGKAPMQRQPGPVDEDPLLKAYDENVQSWMEEAFMELVRASQTGEPFTLLPCTVNGEPTAAIVHLSHRDDRNRFHVTPLFVAMTPGMVLIDPKGRRAGDDPDTG